LFLATPDGKAKQISRTRDDLMGFTLGAGDPAVFFASGHPSSGGNLGVIVSTDGGQTWGQIAKGVRGPVDFHQMDASKADAAVIYGVFGGTQVSRDGGKTWAAVGPAPEGLIAIAAGAKDANTLYAATESGLQVSRDGGRTWQAAYLLKRPVSMVHVASDGTVYAYVIGTGLIKNREGDLISWKPLGRLEGDTVMLQFAVGAGRLYAVTQRNEILLSEDDGQTWRPYASAGRGSQTQ
jgi:photosystem II stability/assembly factor-like uncharacterized protein